MWLRETQLVTEANETATKPFKRPTLSSSAKDFGPQDLSLSASSTPSSHSSIKPVDFLVSAAPKEREVCWRPRLPSIHVEIKT